MSRMFSSRRKTIGLAPGSLVYVGQADQQETKISLIEYDEGDFEQVALDAPADATRSTQTPSVSWINVDGLRDVVAIDELGKLFGVHPLTLEDVVNTTQRPKVSVDPDSAFVVLKMLSWDDESQRLVSEQVSLIFGDGYLLSFQERPGDVFGPVRARIRNSQGHIRHGGADYLAFALMDAIVDNYYLVIEKLGDRIEALEQEIADDPSPETLGQLHRLKREVAVLRRACWPLREEIGLLVRNEVPLIRPDTKPYLRDLYDHAIQTIDLSETLRDLSSSLQDLYLSSISHRTNEVMKVLTIIATIFIPLSFVVGLYGMNFNPEVSPWNMPETQWYWGYPFVLGVLLAVVLIMLMFFRRKRWL